MAECTNESFFYRSLPLSIILMGATKAAVHREILKPNLKMVLHLKWPLLR